MMKGKGLWVAVGVLWMVIVVGAYYVYPEHKPLTPGQAAALLNTVLDVLLTAFLLLISGTIGRWVLSKPVGLSAQERVALQSLIGLGVIALMTLAFGVAGLIHRWLFIGLPVLALIVFRRHAAGWLADLVDFLRGGAQPNRWAQFLWAFILTMLFLGLLNALAPPTAWDGLTYHLPGPQQYIADGHIHGDIDNHYLGFPQLGEMLFMWGMVIRGNLTAAAPVQWIFGGLVVLLLGGFTARIIRPGVGSLAGAILLTAWTFWLETGWPYVDIMTMAYIFGGFVAVERWRSRIRGHRAWLSIAAVLAGFALGTKYTAVGMVAGLGVLVLWESVQSSGGVRAALRNGAIFASVAFAAFAPWLIRNMLLYGNPVYPFFFEGPRWDSWRQVWFARSGTGLLTTDPAKLLRLPWYATVESAEGAGGLGASIGPLFLGLLPLLIVVWRTLSEPSRRVVKSILVFCIAPLAVWLFSISTSVNLEQTRLILTIFAFFAVLAAIAIHEVERLNLGLKWGFILRALVGFVMALALVQALLHTIAVDPVCVLTGCESQQTFLLRSPRVGTNVNALNKLPPGARVMMLWEPRSLYCPEGRECRGDYLLDRWYHSLRVYETPDAVAAAWADRGMTHVLAWETGAAFLFDYDPYLPGDREAFDAFRAAHLREIWEEPGGYVLYALEGPASSEAGQ